MHAIRCFHMPFPLKITKSRLLATPRQIQPAVCQLRFRLPKAWHAGCTFERHCGFIWYSGNRETCTIAASCVRANNTHPPSFVPCDLRGSHHSIVQKEQRYARHQTSGGAERYMPLHPFNNSYSYSVLTTKLSIIALLTTCFRQTSLPLDPQALGGQIWRQTRSYHLQQHRIMS